MNSRARRKEKRARSGSSNTANGAKLMACDDQLSTQDASRGSRNKLSDQPKARPRSFWIAIGSFSAFLLSLAANIVQLWGPFWPTAPVFQPTAPAYGQPTNIAFSVENKSAVFDIKNMHIGCLIINSLTKNKNGVVQLNLEVEGKSIIEAGAIGFYKCPFNKIFNMDGDALLEATISFNYEYDSIFGGGTKKGTTGVFTLDTSVDPPRWLVGKVIP